MPVFSCRRGLALSFVIATILAAPGCSNEPKPPIDLNDKPVVDQSGSKAPAPATREVEITTPKR